MSSKKAYFIDFAKIEIDANIFALVSSSEDFPIRRWVAVGHYMRSIGLKFISYIFADSTLKIGMEIRRVQSGHAVTAIHEIKYEIGPP